jgi:hypothetical protein
MQWPLFFEAVWSNRWLPLLRVDYTSPCLREIDKTEESRSWSHAQGTMERRVLRRKRLKHDEQWKRASRSVHVNASAFRGATIVPRRADDTRGVSTITRAIGAADHAAVPGPGHYHRAGRAKDLMVGMCLVHVRVQRCLVHVRAAGLVHVCVASWMEGESPAFFPRRVRHCPIRDCS